jgi:hypothetical protein
MNWFRLTFSRSAVRASSAWSVCGIRSSRRPLWDPAVFGSGTSLPSRLAAKSHAAIASEARSIASSGVAPRAVQPGSASIVASHSPCSCTRVTG